MLVVVVVARAAGASLVRSTAAQTGLGLAKGSLMSDFCDAIGEKRV
jgi:hypothetical protein